jgi:glucosamine-6-phosphate deaminase
MSKVEAAFPTSYPVSTARVPFKVVKTFPQLGFFTALRFLEWAAEHPEGTISLPTGKTPEYFIKWVQYILEHWQDSRMEALRKDHGLELKQKPNLKGLQFIQIDEFYPIDPRQHNSFYNYVQRFYIQGFGLDPRRGLFMNCHRIPTPDNKPLNEIFPESVVDLSLRFRDPESKLEELQQQTIFLVDQWCSEYEDRIREKGGIGFFLGGIGPDGHIAFNVRGSDHNSTTRLMETNFETQAAAAVDLGGIEISRRRLVITIGLGTITFHPETVAIIFAAGAAKAEIVKATLESEPDNRYPGTVLQRLKHSRFYLTHSAAQTLEDVKSFELNHLPWDNKRVERAVIQLCQRLNKFGHRLTLKDLQEDPVCSRIPGLSESTVPSVLASLKQKLDLGITLLENETFLHTGPHHDDIMLGFLPHITHLVRSPKNQHHFAILTSGFTSVTNRFLYNVLKTTQSFLDRNEIQMVDYPDFFQSGYRRKWDKDVYHFLDRIASRNQRGQQRGLSHRVVRALVEIYQLASKEDLSRKIDEILDYLGRCYDGEKNIPPVQKLKGMIREFEEELVWAHFGVRVRDVHHLRLGFYTGDIFTANPEQARDVEPILELLREIKPTVISLAMDPEGSGPDTHYKVLQAIAEALRQWQQEADLSRLQIWGYRNVWYRFDPAEADVIVPVSLNSLAMLRDTFLSCYLSQKDASFPSYELDGPFCDLAQKIWVEQHALLELVLGRDFWYRHDHPRLRATHGLVFLRTLNLKDFLREARRLEASMEGTLV